MIGSLFLWIATIVILAIVIGSFIIIYNGLVRLKRSINKSRKNIDVLLKQRNDELPKIIDTCKEYMGYEKGVINEVTEKRTEAQKAESPKEEAKADEHVKQILGKLFAVAEDYPELKANKNFQQLQNRISSLEDQIADRREFYNSTVNTYNIRINQIPYNIIANLLGYQEKELFQVPEEEKADIDISEAFGN